MRSGGLVVAAVAVFLHGCMTLQAYDGPRLPADEVARVQGDYKFRAGAPVSLLLRQVDGLAVDVRYSGVDLLPGIHTLLVDCALSTGSTSRHRLNVDLVAEGRYVIVAETGPGNRECAEVRLSGVSR